MKVILGTILLLAPTSVFANGWTEKVTCEISRTAEDGATVTSVESAQFLVAGPHNWGAGTVEISSGLIPSYSVTYDLVASGRYDLDTLTTTLKSNGYVVAKTSVFDGGENTKFKNQFVTENGDYMIAIECTNSTVRNH